MKNIRDIMVDSKLSVLDAIKILDSSALQILLIVNAVGHLHGTVTDGDIRRAILQGFDLNVSISEIMEVKPVTVSLGTARDVILALMKAKEIHAVPVLNANGVVVGLEARSRLLSFGVDDSCVVIMAGGLGMRLRPLTECLPKPMLDINGRPMLEHIIERFVEQGFRRFYLSVNYKAKIIRNYFGDGSKMGVNITYINEDRPLGTGGALNLLPVADISENILVMNGDLLTSLNFRQLLDFHRKHGGSATMCVQDYSIDIPFGVVQVDRECFVDIVEKPAHSYFVNAGIYAIRSEMLAHIPKNVAFDLPDLFTCLKQQGEKVMVFPLREAWCDVGNVRDYELAKANASNPHYS